MIRHGILAGVLCAAVSVGAYAQAPEPMGVWAAGAEGSASFGILTVSPQGCQLRGTTPQTGPIVIAGACQWQSTSQGGILTIMNIYNYQPAPIRFSIIWRSHAIITVDGDVYRKTDD